MPILSIQSQPANKSINAAYRPLVFLVRAQRTDGQPKPPVVYCDIYINDLYYETQAKTQYKTLNGSDTDWQFDIQDSCQKALLKQIPANGTTALFNAENVWKTIFCRFRSSGHDSNGFIVTEGTSPIQGTGTTSPVSGSGFQSSSFYVLNAVLQHASNQDLATHLQSFKKGTWAANAWPLTHRPDGYKAGLGQSDFYPLFTDLKVECITLHYRKKGETTFTQKNYCYPAICALSVANLIITVLAQSPNQVFNLHWDNVGGIPYSITFEISVDGGATWNDPSAPAVTVNQVDNQNIEYTFVGSTSISHIVRITPNCSASSVGTPSAKTYNAISNPTPGDILLINNLPNTYTATIRRFFKDSLNLFVGAGLAPGDQATINISDITIPHQYGIRILTGTQNGPLVMMRVYRSGNVFHEEDIPLSTGDYVITTPLVLESGDEFKLETV